MRDKLEEPPYFWPMIRSFLVMKSDQEPLPVFDLKGRPIGLGKIWCVDEMNQVKGKFVEGYLESPAFNDEGDWDDDSYREEWGEKVLMVDPVRSGSNIPRNLENLQKEDVVGLNFQSESQIVWWEEVEETAKLIFEHRPCGAGLQSAWHIVIQQGYAQYANEREHVRVLLRFVTLGFLWQTSQLPQKETDIFPLDEYSFTWIGKLLGLSPFRLGWIAGLMNVSLREAKSDSTEFELSTQMLPRLADHIRSEIVEILQNHFGGIEDLSAFFSQHFTAHGWDCEDEEEVGKNLTSEDTLQKELMQTWIQKGCPFPANFIL